ncbi:ABC transporter permease [Paenibacillus sp. CN-4]|uniref:ABC transporter permease n=1 Tax=Paenibacillus nanchangensis TaxID=3348343 RepID=UPI00397E830A
MSRYIVRRLLQAIPVVFGISIIVFAMINLQPGDPYATMIDPNASPEVKEELLQRVGYYDPLYVKYTKWVSRAVQGDLGYSIHYKSPVTEIIGSRVGNTLLLALAALAISVAIGLPVGIITAVRRNSIIDYAATFFAFIGLSLPSFFFGMLLIKYFGVDLKLLPISGKQTVGVNHQGWDYVVDVGRHLLLPAVVLGLMNTAALMRYMRSSMSEILNQDYIRTAKAKGVSRRFVLLKHAMKNALKPVITILSLEIPTLLSGALLTETVFSWPGIGRLNFEAALNRDYVLIMGIVMMLALVTLLANLIADILYAVVDPRIHYD